MVGLRAQDRGQEVARSSIERSFIEFCTQNRGLLTSSSSSGPDGDLPHADQVVCVASKQGLRRETERKKREIRAGEAAKLILGMGNQEGKVLRGPKSALGAGERVKEESSKVWGAGGSQFFICAGFRMLLWCLCLDLGAVPKSSFPFSLPKKGERAGGEAGQGAGKGRVTCPSADQAREVHWGGSALLLVLITSCFSSSTMIFPSRSCAGQEKKASGNQEGL